MLNINYKYTKNIVKYFESFVGKIIFKFHNKKKKSFKKSFEISKFNKLLIGQISLLNYKYTKNIVKYFESSVGKIIFKFHNKKKSFKKSSEISNFNKLLIAQISLLFVYLFYLSIPTLYDKTWLQNTIENKLIHDFKIDFSASSDISYYILPAPHFLIKDTKILRDDDGKKKTISEIKKLKIFVSQKNFFNKEKIYIKKILIDNANFLLQKTDIKFLDEISNTKFPDKKIKIIDSKIFFKDSSNEIITIIKLSKALLFHDDVKLLNLFDLDGEVFKIPFTLSFDNTNHHSRDKKINITAKKLKLNIFNKSIKNENQVVGQNITSVLNSKIYTKYKKQKNSILFESDASKIKNSNINYKGKLSFKPFDLKLDLNIKKYRLSKLLNADSIVSEFLKTKLLFNENISALTSIGIDSHTNNTFFDSSLINFRIVGDKINFNGTKFINKDIGFLKVNSSNLFFENDKLFLNADLLIDIKDINNLFSSFQTPKKNRKLFKKIFINLDYNFETKQIILNSINMNGKNNNNSVKEIINEFNDIEDYNSNRIRRIFNKLFATYEG